jgi:hypothetical protein
MLTLLVWLPVSIWAAKYSAPPSGIGQVADNMMEPVSLIADFIDTACFVIGGSFVFASLIKYIEHRRSPLMVPLSTVIYLLLAGVLLLLLPFASYLTEGGIKYSLLS